MLFLPIAKKHDTFTHVVNEIVSKQKHNDPSKYVQLSYKFVKDEYPDYPQKSEDMSDEDYHDAIKEYFKLKGLKHHDDFNEDDKKSIIEDCTVNLIGPKALSLKHNTMVYVIRCFVRAEGLLTTPDDLSQYPGYPKKSEDMSLKDYQKEIKKFWNTRKQKEKTLKKMIGSEFKILEL